MAKKLLTCHCIGHLIIYDKKTKKKKKIPAIGGKKKQKIKKLLRFPKPSQAKLGHE